MYRAFRLCIVVAMFAALISACSTTNPQVVVQTVEVEKKVVETVEVVKEVVGEAIPMQICV